jgi:uncharacterized protein
MLFAVIATDKPDSLDLRMATREAHFAYARETNVIRLGGPFLDAKGEMAGSLIIFEADDIDSARAMARQRSVCESGIVRAFRSAALEAYV